MYCIYIQLNISSIFEWIKRANGYQLYVYVPLYTYILYNLYTYIPLQTKEYLIRVYFKVRKYTYSHEDRN
jgi:hypothetical protein